MFCLTGFIQRLESSDPVEFITKVSPLAVGIAAFLISSFHERFSSCYKRLYITAKRKLTPLSILVSAVPVAMLCFSLKITVYDHIRTLSFCIFSSIMSIIYPLFIGSEVKINVSLFPASLLMSCLVFIDKRFVYLFTVAFVASFMKFKGEKCSTEIVLKYILTPLMAIGFLLIGKHDETDDIINSGIIGSFTGLLLSEIIQF